jgi:phage-related protein
MWEVDFYQSANGDCPTKEFLDSLHKKEELPFVVRAIGLLEQYGNQLRRPQADFLADGIYELRIPIRHKQFRLLYFYFYQGTIVISHGLRKEAKVKTADIEKAKQHKADYFSRHERKR